MASTPTAFKERLVALLNETDIVTDPATLDQVAELFSQALHDYITQDVQVAAGQDVDLTAGKTVSPGKLF